MLFSCVALPVALFDGRQQGTGDREQRAGNSEEQARDSELAAHRSQTSRHWPLFFERLQSRGRACVVQLGNAQCWVATERLGFVHALQQVVVAKQGVDPTLAGESKKNGAYEAVAVEDALRMLTQGFLQLLGPTTANGIASLAGLASRAIFQQLVAVEMQGLALRGVFEGSGPAADDSSIEWCERRILQRVHRLTLGTLRKQIEAVSPAVFMRWLLRWQHLATQTQLSGEEGVLEALLQLEGFEAPAVEWERTLLPQRVKDYDGKWLDALCLSGAIGWGRISPHPAWASGDGAAPRRVIPTNMAPITFYVRESAEWLATALDSKSVDESKLQAALSPEALSVRATLRDRGACFSSDLQRMCVLSKQQTQTALWELATAGLASADGFDQLRAMMDSKRKPLIAEPVANGAKRGTRSTAGRWSLFLENHSPELTVPQRARVEEASLEAATRMLLQRYGVLFRDLLQREANAPRWRDLLRMLRRLEARGEVRGGRFVTGFSGEQFALPEAVESLRATRDLKSDEVISIAASDPANLIGVIVPGERTAAVAGRRVWLRGGAACDEQGEPLDAVATPEGIRQSRKPRAALPEMAALPAVHSPSREEGQGGLFA